MLGTEGQLARIAARLRDRLALCTPSKTAAWRSDRSHRRGSAIDFTRFFSTFFRRSFKPRSSHRAGQRAPVGARGLRLVVGIKDVWIP